jgi:hypothetical protein
MYATMASPTHVDIWPNLCYNGSTCEASAKTPPSFADPFCDYPLQLERILRQLCVCAASVFCLVEARQRAQDVPWECPVCSGVSIPAA